MKLGEEGLKWSNKRNLILPGKYKKSCSFSFLFNLRTRKYVLYLVKKGLVPVLFFFAFIFLPSFAFAGDGSNNSQRVELLDASKINILDQVFTHSYIDKDSLVANVGAINFTFSTQDSNDFGDIEIYVVKKEDTLSSIAKMFGITKETIIWANDLNPQIPLKEGQVLIILPVSGIRHEVKKGETIKSIAQKYKVNESDILEFNNFPQGIDLKEGDIIIVPDAELPIENQNQKPITRSKRGEKTWGTNAPEYPGYYIRPIIGGRKSQGLHGYNAIDIAAPTGTPILASASGTVVIARYGYNGGYGNYVVLQHNNGTQTLYAHVSKILVSVGDYINQGDKIALVGSTGRSTGSHLHFEIRGAKNPF